MTEMNNNSRLNANRIHEDSGFLREIVSSSEGARILSCIQCGTCSASCPVYEVMDFALDKTYYQ